MLDKSKVPKVSLVIDSIDAHESTVCLHIQTKVACNKPLTCLSGDFCQIIYLTVLHTLILSQLPDVTQSGNFHVSTKKARWHFILNLIGKCHEYYL